MCPECGERMQKRRGWGKAWRWVCPKCNYSEEVEEGER